MHPGILVGSRGYLVIGVQRVELDPDFEVIDLTHEVPECDLVRCEVPRESLMQRRLTAVALRRGRLRQRKAEAE
ncbi:hypothetical protein OKHIL_75980 [Mycolicibacterium mageritense]